MRAHFPHSALVRLTLTTKLATINLLLVTSLVAVVVVAWRMLPTDVGAAADVMQLGRAQRASQNADMLHDALHADVLRALLAGQLVGVSREDVMRSLHDDATAFRAELDLVAALSKAVTLGASSEVAHKAGADYAAQAETTAHLALTDRPAALVRMPQFQSSFETAKNALAGQTEQLALAVETAHANAIQAADNARRWLLAAAAISVVIGWSCVALIARSIRRSLIDLRDIAGDIAAGQLDRRSDRVGADEVGQLGASINRMAGNLQAMILRMRTEAERGAFGSELGEAMDMADSEPQAYEVIARAMALISPNHKMELLIADSSDAHLERAAEHPSAGAPGCGVDASFACISVRRGHALSFAHSEALNACPKLRERGAGPISAACVPVTFMGRALGVLHASGSVEQALDEVQFERLTALGLQAGGRIGTVRAFERTQLQASTDALTGLPNRRTLEQRMHRLKLGGKPFVLVMCDLDHFKRLNDTHGHPAGDDALRTFADVIRSCTREHDLASRWGGEEFAFVLADADEDKTVHWTQRLREQLAQTLRSRSKPVFTASFGIAESSAGHTVEALVRLADEALYRAKSEGRDRTAVADRGAADHERPPRAASEHRANVDLHMIASIG